MCSLKKKRKSKLIPFFRRTIYPYIQKVRYVNETKPKNIKKQIQNVNYRLFDV